MTPKGRRETKLPDFVGPNGEGLRTRRQALDRYDNNALRCSTDTMKTGSFPDCLGIPRLWLYGLLWTHDVTHHVVFNYRGQKRDQRWENCLFASWCLLFVSLYENDIFFIYHFLDKQSVFVLFSVSFICFWFCVNFVWWLRSPFG